MLSDIHFELKDNKNGKSDFICTDCGKVYHMLGPHLDNHYKQHKKEVNNMANNTDNKEKLSLEERIRNVVLKEQGRPKGQRVSKEKYDIIKELLFRGELQATIAVLTHTGTATLFKIEKSKTYEEYLTFKNKYTYHNPKRDSQPTIHQSAFYTPEQLEGIKAKLEEAIIGVIVSKVAEKYQDLLLEKDKWRMECVELRARLYELQKENIGDKINRELDKLEVKEVKNEQ